MIVDYCVCRTSPQLVCQATTRPMVLRMFQHSWWRACQACCRITHMHCIQLHDATLAHQPDAAAIPSAELIVLTRGYQTALSGV